jgi:hypothetical protein
MDEFKEFKTEKNQQRLCRSGDKILPRPNGSADQSTL